MRAVKRTIKRSTHVFHHIEEMRAKNGDPNARERLEINEGTGRALEHVGPLEFPAVYGKMAGTLRIEGTGSSATIGWSSHGHLSETSWVIQINRLRDLAKVDGMEFKRKHFIQWSLDTHANGGLVFKTEKGEQFQLTKVVGRDKIFNRLIAMGDQTWEFC